MTALVTGAAGFVGLSLVRRLRDDGERVRALALPGDRRLPELRALDVEVVEADVTDAAAIAPHFAGVERVFHVAALVHGWHPWERYRAVNVGGTQAVARAARAAGARRLVHISTSDVFGIPRHGEIIDESHPFDYWREPYPDTKIEAEQWLWEFHRESGLPISVIYPGWVYGPGDEALFPGFAQAIRDGLLVFWQRDTKLAWAHVDNLADAIVMVGRDPAAVGQGYLVHDDADGPTLEEVSARLADDPRQIAHAALRAVRSRVRRRRHRPDGLARPAPERRPTGAHRRRQGVRLPLPPRQRQDPRARLDSAHRHRRGHGTGVRVLRVAHRTRIASIARQRLVERGPPCPRARGARPGVRAVLARSRWTGVACARRRRRCAAPPRARRPALRRSIAGQARAAADGSLGSVRRNVLPWSGLGIASSARRAARRSSG